MDTIFEEDVPRARLALLLQHFSELDDEGENVTIEYRWPLTGRTLIPHPPTEG